MIPAWLWPLLAAPFIGSFLGVLITRLPQGAPVVVSRSACPRCGTRLGVGELMPVASFLALRGRCRHCGHRIGWFYPAVELAALAVAAWACWAEVDPVWLWIGCGLGWTLLALGWIDLTSFLLPDMLTLPLLLAGLVVTVTLQPEALADHCLAALLGYGSFVGIGLAYRRLRGREGLGGGDAKLIAAAGAWCGLEALPWIVFGSAALGLLAALGLALTDHTVTPRTRIPFGICIALTFWMVWLS
ncbi:MAG: prepilin peptidase [Acetobacteraceae bacterium]|nr:prepilin peptidase [Alphaproteobacteria bacterium]MBV8576659.1 prepilin peptidase [Acetobacteraceae bacterium]